MPAPIARPAGRRRRLLRLLRATPTPAWGCGGEPRAAGSCAGVGCRLAQHFQQVQTATVRAQHLEAEAAEFDLFAALRQVAEGVGHEAAYRLELLVAQTRGEV